MKKLIYVSHPSSGKIENTLKVEKIIKELYKHKELYENLTFVSPIHCYGFMYNDCDYDTGLSFCTDLLEHCSGMLLCGDWEKSTGCKVERQICLDKGIPIVEVFNSDDIENKKALIINLGS